MVALAAGLPRTSAAARVRVACLDACWRVAALATLVMVVLTGDAGARAVWGCLSSR